MKKIVFIITIALSAVFLGCGEDDTSRADLRWVNNNSDRVADIVWVSDTKVDARWNGDCNVGDSTQYKGIVKLSGAGEAYDYGLGYAADIRLDPIGSTGYSSSLNLGDKEVTIEENAAATLVIGNIAK